MSNFLFQAVEEAQEAAETVAAAAPAVDNIIGQSLQITLIGMLILFASLFVLWGVMELLVRVVKDSPKDEEESEEAPVAAVETADDDLKVKAAVAAAAYAIAKK